VSIDELNNVLPSTDVLALALALTDETRGIIGAKQLELLPAGAVIANVARGGHVDTDALVVSLQSGHLGAACLDVTDPEPLPADHPLWSMDNVFISSHCADSLVYVTHQLAQRVYDNVIALATGQPLVGEVNRQLGY
jgi:phosphoglycerate dehydrogenase-like enzyme